VIEQSSENSDVLGNGPGGEPLPSVESPPSPPAEPAAAGEGPPAPDAPAAVPDAAAASAGSAAVEPAVCEPPRGESAVAEAAAAAPEPGPAEPVDEGPTSVVVPARPAAPKKKSAAKRPAVEAAPAEPAVAEEKSQNMDWYILKVQSNREESIREGLMRRVAIAGLGRYFGDAIVPTEKVTEFKGGKKRVIKRKLYPGYLVVQMEINEDTWFLVRETPGIGDFTGASGHPTPMLEHEVSRIVAKQEEKSEKAPKLKIGFAAGERVKINEGTFENFEGEVDSIDETNGRVTVMINIFGRSTPVELEYWQVETV
jgi:transcriptional antiterminator NusG